MVCNIAPHVNPAVCESLMNQSYIVPVSVLSAGLAL